MTALRLHTDGVRLRVPPSKEQAIAAAIKFLETYHPKNPEETPYVTGAAAAAARLGEMLRSAR
jgi:hypothetical protein